MEIGGKLQSPPRPDARVFENEMAQFAAAFDRLSPPTTPWSTDEFCATYVGRRRTIYEAAAESLIATPLQRSDANSSSFLKAEKIPFGNKPDPAPRLIHPRSPRYNVEVGVYLKKVEHQVYHQVDTIWGQRTVLKGCNAHKTAGILRAKWEAFQRPVAIGLDASRFDQHVSVPALRWEHKRYLSMFASGERDRLAELLSWQLDTKCTARCNDGKVKYRVKGMRFSGDMNTSTGNCLLMSAMVWSFCRSVGISAQLANNGDDCVLFLDQGDMVRLSQADMTSWFQRMGFTLKSEDPAFDFEQIEFCQSRPVYDGERWVMVRKHRIATAKDCLSIKPLDGPSIFDKWRLSVGNAGVALTGGLPVQQYFYAALMRGAAGPALEGDLTQETGFMRFAKGMERTAQEPTAAARYSYWLAYGVTPDEQEALEKEYEAVSIAWHDPGAVKIRPPDSSPAYSSL